MEDKILQQTERIKKHEETFQLYTQLFNELDDILNEIEMNEYLYDNLLAYYQSNSFIADQESANNRQLKKGLKHDLLKEEAIDDLIVTSKAISIRINEIANRILKK